MALPEVCVCYLIRETPDGPQVLLGRKKTPAWASESSSAPAASSSPGQSPLEAVAREVQEEVGITVRADSLVLIGELTYPFPPPPSVEPEVLGVPLSRLGRRSARVRRTAPGVASANRASPSRDVG